MNDGLLDAFRHNAWATRELLAFCRDLTDDQLRAAAEGTYGSINATMWHVVAAEASYWRRLTDRELDWDWRTDDPPDMETLTRRAEEMAGRWEEFLGDPFDAERVVTTRRSDGSSFEVRAGIVLAQALHHGSEHRAQVYTVLSTRGVAPPELDVWAFGLAHGRAHERA